MLRNVNLPRMPISRGPAGCKMEVETAEISKDQETYIYPPKEVIVLCYRAVFTCNWADNLLQEQNVIDKIAL